MSEPIEPCPFCGSVPVDRKDRASVECGNDQCSVKPGVSAFNKSEAIAAWNRRSSGTGEAGAVAKGGTPEVKLLHRLLQEARDQRDYYRGRDEASAELEREAIARAEAAETALARALIRAALAAGPAAGEQKS